MSVFGGDLYHLWRVSEVLLPRIADVHYDANRLIGGVAAGNDEGAFAANTPAYPGASTATYSPTGSAWAGVRDELQDMWAEIGTTVLEAAKAVRDARLAYESTDTEAANQLKAILADPMRHPTGEISNPPAPGSEEDPGRPVLTN